MNAATVRGRRRLLALVALAVALLATTLGLDADRASAAYSARVKAKTLIISGNSASDKLVLIASSTTVALDVGANGTADYTFERDAFTAIDVDAGGGNDEVAVVGSFLGETLTMDGGQGNDVLSGSNADDILRGGPGADAVDGQQGADAAFLGGDDDRFNWDPGDGNDIVQGEPGIDVFDFNGSSIGESIDVSANGGRVRFTRNIGNVVTDLDDVEQIAAQPFAGADVVTINDLAGTDLRTVDVDLNAFGAGGDTLADTVIVNGTGGADSVTPGHVDGRVVIDGLAAQTRVAGDEPALDLVTVRTLAGADTINATVDLGPQPVDADGGEGTDTARYSGTTGDDAIAAVANGLEVTTVANPANPTGRLDTIAIENLNLLGLAGADTITATGNLAPLTALTFDGGADADTLSGGNGTDLMLGRGGEDVVDGQQGIDTAFLGAGNDRFQWDPGDGNDTVEGEDGNDTLAFNGSTIGEKFDVSANGARVRFTRDIANVVTDLDTVEQVALRALGGADTITANDVAGTDLAIVDVDLNAAAGGGDTLLDTVIVNGTGAPDTFSLGHADGRVLVDGVGAQTRVAGSEPALDVVSVRTLAGDDTINATVDLGPQPVDADGGEGTDTAYYNGTAAGDAIAAFANGLEVTTLANPANPTGRLDTIAVENLHLLGHAGADTITATGNLAPLTALTLDGGADADTLSGGNGADQLLGGAGEDVIDGQQGTDTASLGDGDDRFQWDPGDGNDTVEGDIGNDTLAFNGSSIGESIDVSANGQRVRFTRNIGNVVTDLDTVEQIDAHPYAGPDVVTISDLAGTDLNTVDVNLNALGGGGDITADTVIARGTDGPDTVMPGHADGRAVIDGLAVQTRVAGDEPALDVVSVHTLAGDDTINATVDLGPQPVDADGGEGTDTAYYNGTAAGDAIAAFANGLEVTTLANPANPTGRLDTIAVENLHLHGLAGADTITATGNLAPLTALTLDGGADADTLSGGNGPDQLLGGPGEDFVDGQQGTDIAHLGDGDDRFNWDPGDGNDTVEGDIGNDTLAFNGSSIGESIDVSANGQRVRFTRNIGNVVTDLDTVEQVAFKAFGGADTITADDLTGTDLAIVDVDLNLAAGGGDTLADTVVVNGTSNADSVLVTASGTQVLTTGLAAQTRIAGSEAASDTLRVQTLGGNDDVTVDPGVSSLIAPLVDLGADE